MSQPVQSQVQHAAKEHDAISLAILHKFETITEKAPRSLGAHIAASLATHKKEMTRWCTETFGQPHTSAITMSLSFPAGYQERHRIGPDARQPRASHGPLKSRSSAEYSAIANARATSAQNRRHIERSSLVKLDLGITPIFIQQISSQQETPNIPRVDLGSMSFS